MYDRRINSVNLSAWKDRLAAGKYDAPLAALYGAADAPRSRYARLCEEYLRTFGDAPDALLISAPGRTELAGNHTDHQLGIVLCAAVTLDAAAAAASAADNAVEIVSDGFGRVRVSLDDLAPRENETGTTAALIRGVAAGFAAEGLRIGGWRACIHSLIPAGGGLSSSAAFEILTGAIFSALYNEGRVDALTLARIGQSAERNYFGKPSGLMDQAASAFGGITKIDFAGGDRPDVRRIAFDFRAHGYILCAVNTHSRHDDLTPDYAAIPRDMTAVARAFGKDVLRQVDAAAFAAPEIRTRYIPCRRRPRRALFCRGRARGAHGRGAAGGRYAGVYPEYERLGRIVPHAAAQRCPRAAPGADGNGRGARPRRRAAGGQGCLAHPRRRVCRVHPVSCPDIRL